MFDLIAYGEYLVSAVPVIGGAAVLISVVVSVGKSVGVIPDGYAGLVSLGLNAAAWVALGIATQFGVEEEALSIVGALGTFGAAVLPLLLSTLGSKAYHEIYNVLELPGS